MLPPDPAVAGKNSRHLLDGQAFGDGDVMAQGAPIGQQLQHLRRRQSPGNAVFSGLKFGLKTRQRHHAKITNVGLQETARRKQGADAAHAGSFGNHHHNLAGSR